ncbi:ATP-binding cassette domain-containing protein [Patulibacter brassicae]|jgi:D-xylose transport system ATP-binding protein|uniref:ATP-binding cassette domain-containing protein n=1 Tax=Patulibacter brassicae TaxID=1705717 RepID=A0ABU4VEU5_9ACTN|nr:ATP-binding cassette domain-containing protein [Patulibacter brassicae]MDX8150326.1 ATP-binding cassette domain-containing protein [Patulibacter brassicae]
MATETQAGAPVAPAGAGPLLRLTGVSKRFGAVQALSDVALEVRAGEVVALVGDNGAGKSTLIKTISGAGPADTGEIAFGGSPVRIASPADAARLGIAVVYQDLALCDNLDVVANLHLGRERRRGPVLDEITMEREARALLDSLAVRTLKSVRAEVGQLSGGQRQTVAIARAMLGEPRLVILDEPTAALGVAQTEQVLALVSRLRERGMGVILISHNLADVFQVADRIEVLRLGRNGGSFPATPDQRQAVVAAITGVGADPPASPTDPDHGAVA